MRTLLTHIGIACLLSSVTLAQPPAPAKVTRYAATIIQRYDANGDGVLQREEWEKMPGTPQAIDLDGDGQITLDELIWYFMHFGQGRTIHRTVLPDLSEPYRFDPTNLRIFRPVWQRAAMSAAPSTETREASDDGIEEFIRTHEQPIDDDVYQRLLEEGQIPAARPYHVLPENLRGVPAWFILLDRNGDGQISLAEFAPTLAPARVLLFEQLDRKGNGFIEPDEARNP